MSPTFEFYCENCKSSQEEFFSSTGKPDHITCKNCGKKAKSIISGGTGFLLKGHGWSFDRYAGKSNFKNLGEKDE